VNTFKATVKRRLKWTTLFYAGALSLLVTVELVYIGSVSWLMLPLALFVLLRVALLVRTTPHPLTIGDGKIVINGLGRLEIPLADVEKVEQIKGRLKLTLSERSSHKSLVLPRNGIEESVGTVHSAIEYHLRDAQQPNQQIG
jgi:hypothetical protein